MKNGGEVWTVLNLPAISVDGKLPLSKDYDEKVNLAALWPERYDLEHLMLQRGVDSVRQRRFECLYQQNPTPDEGVYFTKDWFSIYQSHEVPEGLVYYIASDYALSEGRGDYTWHLVVGIDSEHNYWVVDGYFGQSSMLTWIDRLIDLVAAYDTLIRSRILLIQTFKTTLSN